MLQDGACLKTRLRLLAKTFKAANKMESHVDDYIYLYIFLLRYLTRALIISDVRELKCSASFMHPPVLELTDH